MNCSCSVYFGSREIWKISYITALGYKKGREEMGFVFGKFERRKFKGRFRIDLVLGYRGGEKTNSKVVWVWERIIKRTRSISKSTGKEFLGIWHSHPYPDFLNSSMSPQDWITFLEDPISSIWIISSISKRKNMVRNQIKQSRNNLTVFYDRYVLKISVFCKAHGKRMRIKFLQEQKPGHHLTFHAPPV